MQAHSVLLVFLALSNIALWVLFVMYIRRIKKYGTVIFATSDGFIKGS